MKALVVEDDPRIASKICEWLRSIGCDAEVTGSLSTAELLLRKDSVNIITLDLALHDSTLTQTIERIAAIRMTRPNAVLIVISGLVTHENEKEITMRGADAMFEKMDITTERSFLGRLYDMATGAEKKPTPPKRQDVLQSLAKRAAAKCNEMQCDIGVLFKKELPPEDPKE